MTNDSSGTGSTADILDSLLQPTSDISDSSDLFAPQNTDPSGDLAALEGFAGATNSADSLQSSVMDALSNSDMSGTDLAAVLKALDQMNSSTGTSGSVSS